VQQQRLLIYHQALGQLGLATATVSGINLDIVCREAGVGRNTVYSLFENASGLISTCLNEAALACAQQLQDAAESNTPVEDVRALARNWLGLCEVLPREVAALLRCKRDALRDVARERLREVLRGGVAAGTFAPDFEPVRSILLSEAFVGALSLAEQSESGQARDSLAGPLADLVLRASR
jgi:AcrR family transcriptional regulator